MLFPPDRPTLLDGAWTGNRDITSGRLSLLSQTKHDQRRIVIIINLSIFHVLIILMTAASSSCLATQRQLEASERLLLSQVASADD
jgi:hypothetical protein